MVTETVVVRLAQLVGDNPAYTLVRMREMSGEGIVFLCITGDW